MDEIMAEWVDFARTIDSSAEEMTLLQLRDHAAGILKSIALDIERQQSGEEQYEKSRGNSPGEGISGSAASIHGTERHRSNFTLLQLSAEFRALRATVLRLWLARVETLSADTIREMIRFNEGIDQALAESIGTYSARSDRTRELFLAILGHDLRAPLATLTASGALLATPGLASAELHKTVARVRRSAMVMSAMVNDLIGYTRTELGSGMPIARAPTDMVGVCRAAIEDAHSTSPGSQFELESTGDLSGMYDSVRLHQLFTNLFVNAAKHGAAGEPVRVRAVGEADAIRVEVNNRGPAIPESAWQEIFQPLVQLSNGSPEGHQDRETSLGLGLYVAREIATLHGGSVEVASSPEEGTTFSVRLPRG
ncbi:MAG: HAMP domain-containing histidine kinase [Pseudomonadota bacterium]|nr:HAMP domain-containing histidine kinase [Pseudomonadota bacterium]